jgi:hypothetical protein
MSAIAAAELDVLGKVKLATVVVGERDVALDEVRAVSPIAMVTSGMTVSFVVVQSGLSTRARRGIKRHAVSPRRPRRSPSSSSPVFRS